MKIISGEGLLEELSEKAPQAVHFKLISAYVTDSGVDWLLDRLSADCQVTIVGRFSPRDFSTGASSIGAVKKLLMKGFSVRCLRNLHAKIFSIDDKYIYIGSANFTGSGLSIHVSGNLEGCTSVPASNDNLRFIDAIIQKSVQLDLTVLNFMDDYLIGLDDLDDKKVNVFWPEDIFKESLGLFCNDFPIKPPNIESEIYFQNPTLPFSLAYQHKMNPSKVRSILLSSKAFNWLISLLKQLPDNEARFGYAASVLHSKLTDDPLPYRSSIKDMLSNLLDFCQLYASDIVSISIPSVKSKKIKLVTFNRK